MNCSSSYVPGFIGGVALCRVGGWDCSLAVRPLLTRLITISSLPEVRRELLRTTAAIK